MTKVTWENITLGQLIEIAQSIGPEIDAITGGVEIPEPQEPKVVDRNGTEIRVGDVVRLVHLDAFKECREIRSIDTDGELCLQFDDGTLSWSYPSDVVLWQRGEGNS